MKPTILLLFVLLIIVIALLVRHAILRTGGAFDEDGNYIAIENDNVTPKSIFELMPELKNLINTEFIRVNDITKSAIQREDFWMDVANFNKMNSTRILKVIKSIKSVNNPNYSHLILLLYTYANFIKFIHRLEGYDWPDLHLLIRCKFNREHVLVGQDKIDIKELKPEQLTQEICDDIVEKLRALPPTLTRNYVESDYYDNVVDYEADYDYDYEHDYDDYEEAEDLIPVDKLQKRLQEMYNDINDRKWALMFSDCIILKSGSKTKVALRTNYED
jgi:hypothetical protein